jgi:predicted metalloendopeptidase
MKLCFQRLFIDTVFDLNADAAVDYGGIGVLIGHEMEYQFLVSNVLN